MSVPWRNHPTVTVLLVLHERSRIPLAKIALKCYKKQDWPNLGLCVINGTGIPLVPGEISFPPSRPPELLRKVALECALGEWCVWWADDCWFAPGYVSAHMRAADKSKYTLAWEISKYSASTRAVSTGYTEGLTGFFRLNPDSERCRVIDGQELVLRCVQ